MGYTPFVPSFFTQKSDCDQSRHHFPWILNIPRWSIVSPAVRPAHRCLWHPPALSRVALQTEILMIMTWTWPTLADETPHMQNTTNWRQMIVEYCGHLWHHQSAQQIDFFSCLKPIQRCSDAEGRNTKWTPTNRPPKCSCSRTCIPCACYFGILHHHASWIRFLVVWFKTSAFVPAFVFQGARFRSGHGKGPQFHR